MTNRNFLLLFMCILMVFVLTGCMVESPYPPFYTSSYPASDLQLNGRWQYYYYPEDEVYFSPYSDQYFYVDRGNWISSSSLPYRNYINTNHFVVIEVKDEYPWRHHPEVLRRFPRRSYRTYDKQQLNRGRSEKGQQFQRERIETKRPERKQQLNWERVDKRQQIQQKKIESEPRERKRQLNLRRIEKGQPVRQERVETEQPKQKQKLDREHVKKDSRTVLRGKAKVNSDKENKEQKHETQEENIKAPYKTPDSQEKQNFNQLHINRARQNGD